MKFDHSSRLLFGALALSLLLHLLAMFGWGWAYPVPPAVPSAAMQVVVVAANVAPVPAETPRPTVPAARPTAAREPVKTRSQPPVAPVLSVEKPAAVAEMVSLATPAVVPATVPAAATGVAAPVAVTSAGALAGESVSDDGLRQYRIELATAARRFRSYPAIARSRGWEGVAEVTVVVSAGLPAPSLRLAKSSGHAVLDEQAIEMLTRAAASTTLPESLRGKSFVVPMPIRFSLQE